MSPNNSGHENREYLKTSFWEFLKGGRKIEIPIIQRDYAQGRQGKESLRKKFLKDLKDALCGGEQLKLDFVYGSEIVHGYEKNGKKEEVKILQPLDGQQRLTTLWLLHWYIAYRAEKINTCAYTQEEIDGESVAERRDEMGKTTVADILKRFTYETRISSREFCENLCKPENFKSFKDGKIVDFIENQTWFYSAWKQDPTIQSMLRMLGGTKIDDGIEGVFKDVDYEYCWTRLTEEAPIVFYYLPLKDFGLSDDLYVKMNARGKPLTPFENFKADLIGYLSKRAANDENWKLLYETIPAKLDNDWTDIFWDKRSRKNKIDEIYFAFLNRFFWNELFVANNSSFEDLDKDSVDEYLGIERYEFLDGEIPISVFKNLEKVLDNYKKYNGEIPLLYGFKDFKFIPEYIGNNNEENKGNNSEKKKGNNSEKKGNNSEKKVITGISRVQRVIFFALCKYFKEETAGKDADFVALKQWMRVVCNLISGKDLAGTHYIRDYPTVRNALEYISKLEVSKDPHDVYKRLADMEPTSGEGKKELSALDRQWNEEIIKAKQILDDKRENLRPYERGKTWEDVIIDAEKHAFFEGAIRFLYQNDKRGVAWDKFTKKWENAQEYFKEGSYINTENADLLKKLISYFEDKHFDILWGYTIFNNKVDSWRYYLLNTLICGPLHDFLLDEAENKPKRSRPDKGDLKNYVLYLLSNTDLLKFAMTNMKSKAWLKYFKDGSLAIYEKNSYEDSNKYIILNTDKYEFLSGCEEVKEDPQILSNENPGTALHYERSDIYFKYKSYNFLRYGEDGFIYLQKKDPQGTDGVRIDETKKDFSAENHYHLSLTADWVNAKGEEKEKKIKNFLSKLEELGDKARAAGHDEVYDPPSNS